MRSETPRGTVRTAGAKFRMDVTPAATRRSATSWAPVAGVAMMPMASASAADDLGQVVEVAHLEAADLGADLAPASMSTIAATGKAPFAESAVVGEGVAEVAGADDDDRPVLGEAELAAHLEQEVLDVVADASGAVRPEVGQVLAHLRRVHAGQLGQPLRRDGGGARLGDLEEDAQVDGKPGHRGLGDAAGGGVARAMPVAGYAHVRGFTKPPAARTPRSRGHR